MKHVGFCIGNERQEFLSLVEEPRPGVQVYVWAITPALALVYPSRGKAERAARRLDRSGLVVMPLYDKVDQWGVGWFEVEP
ncbi:hypothetical protein CKO27_12840 [Thiocystis violacea]|nr:hypothetical protein [Thiocystis violacea]